MADKSAEFARPRTEPARVLRVSTVHPAGSSQEKVYTRSFDGPEAREYVNGLQSGFAQDEEVSSPPFAGILQSAPLQTMKIRVRTRPA